MAKGNQDLRQRIDQSWQALMAALDGIPEERMTEPGAVGRWSIKDVLGHIAYWDGSSVPDILSVVAGKDPADGDGEGGEDFESINLREAAKRADWSLDQVRSELEENHRAVLDALEAADRAGVAIDPEVIDGNTYLHYDDHVPDILAWRERLGL